MDSLIFSCTRSIGNLNPKRSAPKSEIQRKCLFSAKQKQNRHLIFSCFFSYAEFEFFVRFLISPLNLSVILMDWGSGIPGDGRCLFRSVVHGACLREGKSSPSESLQKELADELRAKVADEFIKRRQDTEWFLEGDFDTYVTQMRQPHIWGGEPELLMSSHVLRMPITVYMKDKNSGNLKIIAEYGHEYGKDNPICVLYHGSGHYDTLQSPYCGSQAKMYKKR